MVHDCEVIANLLMKQGKESILEGLRRGLRPSTVRWLLSGKAGGRIPPFEEQSTEVHNDIIEARKCLSLDDFHTLLVGHHVKRSKRLRDMVWPREERNYDDVRRMLETDILSLPKSRRTIILPWAFDKNGLPYSDVRQCLEHDSVSTHLSLTTTTNWNRCRALHKSRAIEAHRAHLMMRARPAHLMTRARPANLMKMMQITVTMTRGKLVMTSTGIKRLRPLVGFLAHTGCVNASRCQVSRAMLISLSLSSCTNQSLLSFLLREDHRIKVCCTSNLPILSFT